MQSESAEEQTQQNQGSSERYDEPLDMRQMTESADEDVDV